MSLPSPTTVRGPIEKFAVRETILHLYPERARSVGKRNLEDIVDGDVTFADDSHSLKIDNLSDVQFLVQVAAFVSFVANIATIAGLIHAIRSGRKRARQISDLADDEQKYILDEIASFGNNTYNFSSAEKIQILNYVINLNYNDDTKCR